MGTADLRLGDAFKLLLIGGGIGAIGMFVLGSIKSVELESKFARRTAYNARAYPSYFWDLRDPGASQANFDLRDYYENSIPREGMFSAPDPDFTQVNFSEAYGPCPYVAPRSL